jgi:zinc transporter, ZIP family
MTVDVWTVTVAACLAALAAGLGALPFAFVGGRVGERWLAHANTAASVFMVAAAGALVWQGAGAGPWRCVLGLAVGIVFVWIFRRLIGDRDDLVLGGLSGTDALKALVIVAVMTVHSMAEGVGIGISYGGGQRLGLLITLAIAAHNVPEGLAISLVLVPRGARVRSAAWWSVFSSLPQPLIAPFTYLFVEWFRPILPAGLGFAAGAMLWIVWSELLPDSSIRLRPCRSTSTSAWSASRISRSSSAETSRSPAPTAPRRTFPSSSPPSPSTELPSSRASAEAAAAAAAPAAAATRSARATDARGARTPRGGAG